MGHFFLSLKGDGVKRFGAIQGDDADAFFFFIEDGFIAHGRLPLVFKKCLLGNGYWLIKVALENIHLDVNIIDTLNQNQRKGKP
jgi:hypothetical protein